MNTIYLCCILRPWAEVMKNLTINGIATPAHIVCWRDDLKDFRKVLQSESFDSLTLQTVEDSWKGLGFPVTEKKVLWSEKLCQFTNNYLADAVRMMNRLEPVNSNFKFEERENFFYFLVVKWLEIIDEKDIELVISPSIPHRVFDYALYVAAKFRKIKFVSFQMTPFGSNTIPIDDINEMPNVPLLAFNQKKIVEPDYFKNFIKKSKRSYSEAIPSYMTKHKNNNRITSLFIKSIKKVRAAAAERKFTKFLRPNTYWVKANTSPQESYVGWLEYSILNVKRFLYLRRLRREYRKHASLLNVDQLPKRYVLIALHYQPEETSTPTGRRFSNQYQLVNSIERSLPEDVMIVIKEHKSQFYFDQEGETGRPLQFYRRVSTLSDRILFADVDFDTFELIDSSLGVITISGTIGWEAIARGKFCLHFGRAWYEGAPFSYRIFCEEQLEEVLKEIASPSVRVDSDSRDEILEDFLYRLSASFVKAVHYKSYLNKSDISIDDSAVNLTSALISKLSNDVKV